MAKTLGTLVALHVGSHGASVTMIVDEEEIIMAVPKDGAVELASHVGGQVDIHIWPAVKADAEATQAFLRDVDAITGAS